MMSYSSSTEGEGACVCGLTTFKSLIDSVALHWSEITCAHWSGSSIKLVK